MANRVRIEKSLTATKRFAAFSLLLLLFLLLSGCQSMRLSASQPNLAKVSACGEGMLAAQAWKCLASGAARP